MSASIGCEADGTGEPDDARPARRALRRSRFGGGHAVEQPLGVLCKRHGRFRSFEACASSARQTHAQLLLQACDMFAELGFRHVQVARGALKPLCLTTAAKSAISLRSCMSASHQRRYRRSVRLPVDWKVTIGAQGAICRDICRIVSLGKRNVKYSLTYRMIVCRSYVMHRNVSKGCFP